MPIRQYSVNQNANGAAGSGSVLSQAFGIARGAIGRGWHIALWAVLVLYFLFCGLVLTLRYAVLPNIDQYQHHIESSATDILGHQVVIGRIESTWRGLRPHLTLHDLALQDQYGNQILQLPKISATLSWRSLLAADLRLHVLEITRPTLEITRGQDGKLDIAGIIIDPSADSDGKTMAWVFSQREIVIRDGSVRWNDLQRNAPEMVLTGVDLVIRNEGRHHRVALKAAPPAELAAPLDIRADFVHPYFTARHFDPRQWRGVIYLDGRDADLAAWRSYFDYPFELRSGMATFRAWLHFEQQRLTNITADLALSDAAARLHQELPELELLHLGGRVIIQQANHPVWRDATNSGLPQDYAITLSDFSLKTRDGLDLPATTLTHAYAAATSDKPQQFQFGTTQLELETIGKLADYLPLPAAARQVLAGLAPRGQIRDFSAQMQGEYPDTTSYRIKGHFLNLGLSPYRLGARKADTANMTVPGFSNLSGHIRADQQGGELVLDTANGAFHLPGYLAVPELSFERLEMKASWGWQNRDLFFVDIGKMNFTREGASGMLKARHVLSPGQEKEPGMLDLTAQITSLDLNTLGRYLPAHTPEALRHWLSAALVGGQARDVSVAVKGSLSDFPFATKPGAGKAAGIFHVKGHISNGLLNYMPAQIATDKRFADWPLLEHVNGQFVIDRSRLSIHADKAMTHNVSLSDVRATIPDLTAAQTVLQVTGDANGKLQDFIRYVNDSPVAGWTGNFTNEVSGSGEAALALELQLPLAHMEAARVKGELRFAGNDIRLYPFLPPVLQTNGKLSFTEKEFSVQGIQGIFLGSPIVLAGGGHPDGSTEIRTQGTLLSKAAASAFSSPVTQRLMDYITGSARYSVWIRVKNSLPEVIVESDLQGMSLNFPAPLNKLAADRLPLRFQLTGLPAVDRTQIRDEIRLSLGTTFSARYLREKVDAKGAAWKLVRGGIGVNMPVREPDSGLFAHVDLNTLNVDAWRHSIRSILGDEERSKGEGKTYASGFAQYVEPDIVAIHANQLLVMDKKLDNVVIGASRAASAWQVNIHSDQASGYATWKAASSQQEAGKLTARLASLIIPETATSDVSELLAGKNRTAELPSLDIIAEDFQLSDKKLGKLQLIANNTVLEGRREWHIDRLLLNNPDAQLSASGKWISNGKQDLTALSYSLDIANAGTFLERFGFAGVLRGGTGKMSGNVNWKGLPFSMDLPSLAGDIVLEVQKGQFLRVDPGAAKLLGVLSLQSLPRRLVLDFRDIFSEGLVFDGIAGTAAIKGGTISTSNLKMRSVNAVVLLDGSADIAKETQHLRVIVVPEINAGAASVVYGLVANPIIGLGSFLAQLFLRDPLRKAFTVEYEVKGPWKDPDIRKIERKFGDGASSPDPSSQNRTVQHNG